MSSREAKRKQLQRAGYAHWQILVHPPTFRAALLAEGLISETQIEDPNALREAAGRFIERHCSIARLLTDKTESPKLPKDRMSGGRFWKYEGFLLPTWTKRKK